MEGTDLPNYRATYLDKIFKKSRCLLMNDDIYIIVLTGWFPEELKEVLLACVPKPVPNLYLLQNLLQLVLQCIFYHIGNTDGNRWPGREKSKRRGRKKKFFCNNRRIASHMMTTLTLEYSYIPLWGLQRLHMLTTNVLAQRMECSL